MATVVEYVLSLKDQMSTGLAGANTQVNKLESSLVSAKGALGSITGMLGTLGVGFAIFKGAEFVHEGVEAFHQLEQSSAKLEANLKSTGQSAGLGMGEITAMAKALSKQVQFSRAEVMDMQSQLLTFPSITKSVFEQSMGMVTDIAKQTNHGLSETAIMFGKAFANPEQGLQKLMRYGVMFTDSQKEMVTKLQEGGKIIEAQKYMLDAIATSGYAGVAKAMAEADPLFQYNKIMGGVKVTVGELATDLLKKLTPALEIFANSIKTATDWIKENGSKLYILIKAVGAGIIAFKTMTLIISPLVIGLSAVAPAAVAAELGMTAVGVASTLALGPIALLASAIAGVVYTYNLLDIATKNLQDNRIKKINEAGDLELAHDNASLKGAISIGQKKSDAIKQIFDERMDYISSRRKALESEWKNQATNSPFSQSAKDFADDWNFKKNVLDAQEKSLKNIGVIPPAIKSAAVKKDNIPAPATKATGSKAVTINVSIKDLVNSLTIQTTNIKDGAVQLKNIIANVLAEAVNDFQVVALNH